MRIKVVFLLLFVLSFTVMHDTVIHLMQGDDTKLVTHYATPDQQVDDVVDVHDLHSMFHFVALVTHQTPLLEIPQSIQQLQSYTLQYAPAHQESSIKPPIV